MWFIETEPRGRSNPPKKKRNPPKKNSSLSKERWGAGVEYHFQEI